MKLPAILIPSPTARPLYPVKVYFIRRFNAGPLAGLTHADTIPHVSLERAKEWLKGVRRNSRKGAIDYTVTRFSFQLV